eukprot:510306-Prorocentrum_minimum.AAC.5
MTPSLLSEGKTQYSGVTTLLAATARNACAMDGKTWSSALYNGEHGGGPRGSSPPLVPPPPPVSMPPASPPSSSPALFDDAVVVVPSPHLHRSVA